MEKPWDFWEIGSHVYPQDTDEVTQEILTDSILRSSSREFSNTFLFQFVFIIYSEYNPELWGLYGLLMLWSLQTDRLLSDMLGQSLCLPLTCVIHLPCKNMANIPPQQQSHIVRVCLYNTSKAKEKHPQTNNTTAVKQKVMLTYAQNYCAGIMSQWWYQAVIPCYFGMVPL